MQKELLEIGKIVNTHGIKGELKLLPHEDDPGDLRGLQSLFIDGRELKVLSARVHKGALLVTLEGVNDMDAALEYKGRAVCADRSDPGLSAGFVFMGDLIGCEVYTESGEPLGAVEEIIRTPAHEVYAVRGNGPEHLIPAVPEFLKHLDTVSRRLTVRLIEGM